MVVATGIGVVNPPKPVDPVGEKLTGPDDNTRLLKAQREIISRKELKPFTKRTNRHGLTYLGVHLSLIGCTGYLVYLATSSAWMIPAMFIHGVVLGHLFAPLHECTHGTPFRTRWLNEAVLWFTGLVIVWTPNYFRYDHAGHHTHAQEYGKDPEYILPTPSSWVDYLYWMSGLNIYIRNFGWIFRHAIGRIHPFNRQFVPEEELPKIYWEARIMLAIYIGLAAGSVALETWAVAIYWAIPTLLGVPVARGIRVADHVGCKEGELDLRKYARTLRTDGLTRFLCWNMPYHCEHHLAPSVPFHALPALHKKIGHELNPTDKGFLAVQWDALRRHLEPNLKLHLGRITY